MTEKQDQTPVETTESPESYQKQHAKVLRFEISVGADDDATTLEQFENLVREALAFARDHGPSVYTDPEDQLRFHNLTIQGGYYIIDGKVCLTVDYDAATKNRKPGTYPPVWAGGPDPKTIKSGFVDTTDDDEEEATPQLASVRDIYPEGYKKPERNEFGRRVRKDKGVKRGPRKEPADKIDLKSKVAELGQQMKEAQGG